MAQKDASSLKARLRGELIQRGDPGYDEARKLYNGMIDKKPRLIARCVDADDVTACVNFARDSGLLLAIRGGGHNGGGLGSCDDGLVIDLSRMRGVRVSPATRTAQVAGGCVFGDADHATHGLGLAVPSGIISTTGVAGLTLGGGIGHLSRKYGLTIDSLLEVDLVLADGRFVTANQHQHADLFWAVRGGGGNFGVVTSFTFRLHPVHTVHAGPMFWPVEAAAEIMPRYQEFITSAPEDINGFFAFLKVPPAAPFPEKLHRQTMCGVVWCYTGEPDKVEQVLAPVRGWPQPAFEMVGPMPFPALQTMFDPLYPPGLQWYWRADFVDRLSDEAIGLHQHYGTALPTLQSTMHLYPINGAVQRVKEDETPFSYRNTTWAQVIVGVDPDPANKERIISWTKEYWDALHPHNAAGGGAYVNFMMDEGPSRVEATYRGNYQRLTEIKAKYDPDNLFRVNQNIPPVAVRHRKRDERRLAS